MFVGLLLKVVVSFCGWEVLKCNGCRMGDFDDDEFDGWVKCVELVWMIKSNFKLEFKDIYVMFL